MFDLIKILVEMAMITALALSPAILIWAMFGKVGKGGQNGKK